MVKKTKNESSGKAAAAEDPAEGVYYYLISIIDVEHDH